MPSRRVRADPHPVDRHVGRRVAERRLGLGYTQADLGRALGLTFQQVQKYENGTNRISASKLWETAAFLEVEVDSFFEGLSAAKGPGGVEPPRETGAAGRPSRQSVEIARLAPQLSTERQRLALALLRAMADSDADATEPN